MTVTWRFDYYWQYGVNPKNGKRTQEVLELFEINSTPITSGTGTFQVTLFTKEGKQIVNQFKPVGTHTGIQTVTITPTGERTPTRIVGAIPRTTQQATNHTDRDGGETSFVAYINPNPCRYSSAVRH